MSLHLQREIERLKTLILSLCARVEGAVHNAVNSVACRDESLARKVIEDDAIIDRGEVEVEEECLKILALHQPVANDLRYIIAVLKLNNDLERIGDLAVNIAQCALYLASRPTVSIPFDLPEMTRTAQDMVRRSIDALVNADPAIAREVCAHDEKVDAINREMYDLVAARMRNAPDEVDSLIRLLSVSRNLERMADHATNIAEDVIYMVEGSIIRHGDGGPRRTRSPESPTP